MARMDQQNNTGGRGERRESFCVYRDLTPQEKKRWTSKEAGKSPQNDVKHWFCSEETVNNSDLVTYGNLSSTPNLTFCMM
jgi:hypothetical protein